MILFPVICVLIGIIDGSMKSENTAVTTSDAKINVSASIKANPGSKIPNTPVKNIETPNEAPIKPIRVMKHAKPEHKSCGTFAGLGLLYISGCMALLDAL